MNNQMHYTFTN